ncbi:MAG TPA: IS110 family transposase [Candidatus Acidoferrales bacterium]|jgi:transposase|nr:IS110 family transposase [Candidatus Acidoferrales bacterium]
MEYIAFDAHKHYTVASVEHPTGEVAQEVRLPHQRGAIRKFLAQWTPGSSVAVETVGNWYWLVDEIEAAGMVPRLVHARKAKLMLGMINKTDKLDVRGLNRLQRAATLPTVWIPSADMRDQRDLPRTRMVLVRTRTRLKNRIHATLAKYALTVTDVSDLFGKQGRALLTGRLAQLPPHTHFATDHLLEQLEALDKQIAEFEDRMHRVFGKTPALDRLMSLPGVGFILGIVILLEVGDVHRFPNAEHLAAYAGTTPRVSASGGKIRFGQLRPDVNHYLKWAYMEAAEVVCRHRGHWPQRHVSQLYARLCHRKNHDKAIGAVARHLAEATYWILTKEERYREPKRRPGASTTA